MGSYAKAIIGALVAGLAALQAALDDGGITAAEGIAAAIATLVALGAIWVVPNKPTTG